MSSRARNLLFAGLMLLAFASAGYKTLTRSADVAFAASIVKPSSLGASRFSDMPYNSANAPRSESHFVSSNPGQAVHAPSLVELRNGGLRAVWFSGSREGAGDVTVQTAIMNPPYQHWEAETTLFNRKQLQRSLWRYIKKIGNPVIARAPDGSLHLWIVNVSLGGWAGSAITWARSVDEGKTWSSPRRLVTSPFLNISTLVKGAPVAMANGAVSLPVYHEFVTKFAEVLQINPQGQVTGKTRIPGSQTSLQPVLLVASPTEATAYMRAGQGGRVMMSSTADAGNTWGQASSTNLPNPDSALAALTTRTGDRLLALNPTAAGRQSMALLKADSSGSFDAAKPVFVEGAEAAPQELKKTSASSLSVSSHADLLGRELKAQGVSDADTQAYVASAARQLCSAAACVQEFSYPFLLQTRDGSIHLVYTWQRSRIKHVRIDHAALN